MAPVQKFKVGALVASAWQAVRGTVAEVDWSTTFGQWSYLIVLTEPSRYGQPRGHRVWICESDLRAVQADAIEAEARDVARQDSEAALTLLDEFIF